MNDPELTPAQIAQNYSAAMDSVNLINGPKPDGMSTEEWADTILRNKQHIGIMLGKPYWTTEDLTPLNDALTK